MSIEYDPGTVSLEEILDIFFASHDPTTLNRQGNDVGTQYRSVIFYDSEEQKAFIDAYIEKAGADFKEPIVTEVAKLERFYPAEEHHQDYFERNPDKPYSLGVISPKVEKIKELLGIPRQGSDIR